MKKFVSLIILCFVISVLLFSQKVKLFQFSGIILDSITNESVEFATIITCKGKGTISDNIGRFSIIVQENDTISISSVGYKQRSLVFPDTLDFPFLRMDIYLKPDTFAIDEVIILPWATYEDFVVAVMELELPDDDLKKAERNIELISKQYLESDYTDASISYKNTMKQHFNRAANYGTFPTNNLLNPFAWAKFFEAIRNGDFNRKD